MSHSWRASAARRASGVSTRSNAGSKPPRRSSRTSSSASSSESSTIRTRNGACISEPSGHWRCPVHEQPVQPELLGRLGEFHEVHRFPHIAVGAEPVAIDEVALLDGYRLGANSYVRKPVGFVEFKIGRAHV